MPKPKKINPVKATILVEITIGCTEPESFQSSASFANQDGKAMVSEMKSRIRELKGAWNYAAKVTKVTLKRNGK